MSESIIQSPEVFSLFGAEATGEVPADLSQLLAVVGEKRVYDLALTHLKFHRANQKWRPLLLDKVAKAISYTFPEKDKPKPTEDTLKKLKEAHSGTDQEFDELLTTSLQEVINENTFLDIISATESSSTVGKEWIKQGETIIALVKQKYGDSPDRFATFLQKQRELVPHAKLDDDFDPSPESVGVILKAYQSAQQKSSLTNAI